MGKEPDILAQQFSRPVDDVTDAGVDQARRADLRRLWYWLLQRPNRLLDLGERPLSDLQSRHYAGVQPILLDKICGSQSRANGFDARFDPKTDRMRERWLSVAIARLQRIPLEPIKLIELHAYYFVQDGHHRISVARALGESALDAEVILWRA